MASFRTVDHELIMCGKTETLLRHIEVSANIFICYLSCFCAVRVETYPCVCVCECVVQQFNSRLLCSVSHVVLVLNVDLFAVSLPWTPSTEEVMSHSQIQRWLITNFKQFVRVMLDSHFCPRRPPSISYCLYTWRLPVWTGQRRPQRRQPSR